MRSNLVLLGEILNGFFHLSQFKNLKFLKIAPLVDDINDENFITFIQNGDNLRDLQIFAANQLTDHSVANIENNSPSLQKLILNETNVSI